MAGFIGRVAGLGVAQADRRRVAGLRFRDAGHGYDPLGLNREWVLLGLGITRLLYDVWFRVESRGIAHVPVEGPAVLASNHSGMLPLDAMMLWTDVVRRTQPVRVPRIIVDVFVPHLPVISTLFTRTGAVTGARGNVRHLLEAGELVLIFPEGTPGIAKGVRHAYELQPWRVGHAEAALRHRAPVVPVAVVGAEEAWPQIARVEWLHPFGVPHLPIPAFPIPLPIRVTIHYGEPMLLHERFGTDADDPAAARAAAEAVRQAVQDLLDYALAARYGTAP